MPLVSMLRISTPMKLPKIVPRPPNSATPPMITAAITCSSRLTPALSGARPTRPNSSAALRPHSPPISTKHTSFTRFVSMPLLRAASTSPPVA